MILMAGGTLNESASARSWAILLGILSAASLVALTVRESGRRWIIRPYEQGFQAGLKVGEERGEVNGRGAALIELTDR